jgi:ribosome-associated heat shock protein Hsp15
MSTENMLRIDRWLFFCRFYKTRVLASAAVTAGHVKLNDERATPGSRVRSGDRIDLVRDRLPYALTVTEIPVRRGPAKEAKECFVEDEKTVALRDETKSALSRDRLAMPRTPGRPDKHTRRKLMDRNRNS